MLFYLHLDISGLDTMTTHLEKDIFIQKMPNVVDCCRKPNIYTAVPPARIRRKHLFRKCLLKPERRSKKTYPKRARASRVLIEASRMTDISIPS